MEVAHLFSFAGNCTTMLAVVPRVTSLPRRSSPSFRFERPAGGRYGSWRACAQDDASEENSRRFVVGRIAKRTLLVSFKCNVCEERTERLVNPLAWNKGTVFVQCKNCEIWHRIKDNLNLIDEIRYKDEE